MAANTVAPGTTHKPGVTPTSATAMMRWLGAVGSGLSAPSEVHLSPGLHSVDIELDHPHDLNEWYSAVGATCRTVLSDQHLGQRITRVTVEKGGWTVTLRHIHTGITGAHP
jgi:hypothetical protein